MYDDSDSDTTIPFNDDFSEENSDDDSEPVGSDCSASQELSGSTKQQKTHNHSSLKEEGQPDGGVSSRLDSAQRRLGYQGQSQDDAICLSSDSETEDKENKPKGSKKQAGIDETMILPFITSTSKPRKCKSRSWTDAEKRQYAKEHRCIGKKGQQLKERHRDTKCEACGLCTTCTSPPWCSKLESHICNEKSAQNRTCAAKDDETKSSPASQSKKTSKQAVPPNSPKTAALPKRKRSVDQMGSRKKPKACRTPRNVGGRKLVGPSPGPAPHDEAMEENTPDARCTSSTIREFEGQQGIQNSVDNGTAGLTIEVSPESANSSPRDQSKKVSKGPRKSPKKDKKKKRKKKMKSKRTVEQSGTEIEVLIQMGRMMKLMEDFEARHSAAPLKIEETETRQRTVLDASLMQSSASNFLIPEDSQLALQKKPIGSKLQTQDRFKQRFSPARVKLGEAQMIQPCASLDVRNTVSPPLTREDLQRVLAALQNMPIAPQAPFASRGIPGGDNKWTNGLQFTQNSPARPDFNTSAPAVLTSDAEHISRAPQLPRQVPGVQDGKDTVSVASGTDLSHQAPRVLSKVRQQENSSVASRARPDTTDCTVAEEESTGNDVIRRLRQERNDKREAFAERLRQQSSTGSEVVTRQNGTSLELTSPPHRIFPNRERTQIMLLILIIFATATTEPPILNGIIFILVAFGIVMAESGIWDTS